MPEEIGLLLIACVWLLMWTPAVALAVVAAPRAQKLLRRRDASKGLSPVVQATVWIVIVLAYSPIFTFLFLSFLDLFIGTFSSE
jgi:hypothetical protein